jgi:hypothetical protein
MNPAIGITLPPLEKGNRAITLSGQSRRQNATSGTTAHNHVVKL